MKEEAFDCPKAEDRIEDSEGAGEYVVFVELSIFKVTFPGTGEEAEVAFSDSAAFEVK